MHEKLALVAILSLRVFSCIASIVRLHSIRINTESSDPFHDSVPINLWSIIEANMGILCASIPATKALFSMTQKGRTQNGTYQYHSRECSVMKGYANGNKGSSAGTVIPIEPYGAWRVPDSDVPDERVVWPKSRV
jgi:hypothetical protein